MSWEIFFMFLSNLTNLETEKKRDVNLNYGSSDNQGYGKSKDATPTRHICSKNAANIQQRHGVTQEEHDKGRARIRHAHE